MKCFCKKKSNFKKKITDIRIGKYNFSIYNCTKCGIRRTYPILTKKEIESFHDVGHYRDEEGKRFNILIEYLVNFFNKKRAKRIMSFKSIGKILDIGAGKGLLLSILKKKGWKVLASEVNYKTADVIRNRFKLPVLEGDIDKCKIKKNSFDVINMSHVLEHLKDPISVIKKCRFILKKEGFIFIAIPNNDSLQSKFGKKHWYHLSLPYHLYHLTEKNLLDLLKLNDFEIKYIKHFDGEMNIFGWAQTILNCLGIKRDFLFDILAYRSFKNLRKSMNFFNFYSNLFFTFISLILILPISFLFSILEAIIQKGGCIEVCAQLKK